MIHGRILTLATVIVFSFLNDSQAKIVRFSPVTPEIWRGSQPENLADYQTLKDRGIRTIVTLRSTNSVVEAEIAAANSLGMEVKEAPLHGLVSILVPPAASDVNRALEYITDPSLQPVFLHCHHGKDRTSLIVGLYRVLYQNWSPKTAFKEMKKFDFSPFMFGLKEHFEDATGWDD